MSIQDALASATGFEWDAGNEEKSWHRHDVTTAECEQIFFNQPLVVAADARHSQQEDRFYALGRTGGDRRLFVVFTMRGTLVRVISARDMSRKERRLYATYFAQ
jgi:uncharacterized DUF497 family protein